MSFTDRRFRLGDWVVDVDGCKIERDGAVKRLEPRVMATLAYLASMSDNCVSREELRLNVWKGAHVVDHAILRCISKLRDALEDDAANPRYIQTVPRRGYVIASENITPVASEKAQAAAFPPRTYASLGVGLTALILAAGAAFVLLSTRSPTESLEASVGSKETPVVGTLEQEREAAERFLLRGEFADAQKKIRDIQEQEPLDPYATAALARIAFYQGKPAEAMNLCYDFAVRVGGDQGCAMIMGEAALQLGRLARARRVWNHLRANFADQELYARLRLAELRLMRSTGEDAERQIQLIVEQIGGTKSPLSAFEHRTVAMGYGLLDRPAAAFAALDHARAAGWRDYRRDETETAFQSLRGDPRYAAHIASLKAATQQ